MKEQIVISRVDDDNFVVRVIDRTGATEHHVSVPTELREHDTPVEELVRATIRFLLDRKDKEDIRDRLELAQVRRNYPEYDEQVLQGPS